MYSRNEFEEAYEENIIPTGYKGSLKDYVEVQEFAPTESIKESETTSHAVSQPKTISPKTPSKTWDEVKRRHPINSASLRLSETDFKLLNQSMTKILSGKKDDSIKNEMTSTNIKKL